MHDEEVLLTTQEVEKLYKVDRSTQKHYRKNGTWSYMRPGGRRIYYKKSVLDTWVESNQIHQKNKETP